MLFGGSNAGPQGSRWRKHGPMPRVRWVERRKGAFGSFERALLFHTLLKGAKQTGLISGPRCLRHGPMPWGRWVETEKGAFGSFKRVLRIIA